MDAKYFIQSFIYISSSHRRGEPYQAPTKVDFHHFQSKTSAALPSSMAASFSSTVCRILVVVAVIVATLSSYGTDA